MFPSLTVWFCPAPAAPKSPSPLTLQPPRRMWAPPKSFCPELSSAFCPPAHWASSQPFLLDQGPSVAAFPLPFRLGCPSHVADSIQAFERNMSLQTGHRSRI